MVALTKTKVEKDARFNVGHLHAERRKAAKEIATKVFPKAAMKLATVKLSHIIDSRIFCR